MAVHKSRRSILSLKSWLFTPATKADRFGRAAEVHADALIIDLEDAVARSDKQKARTAALQYLEQPAGSRLPVALRINAPVTRTMDTQELHFDATYAAKTEWKKPLVDSTFTLALLTGMSVRTVSAKVVANLGWDKVKATHPVFAGDTLYAESTILFKRESKSRPTQGIVTVSTRGVNQDGVEVMSFERTMLIYKRGHSPEAAANY